MDRKVRTMLENLYHIFTDKYRDPLESWDKFLEFIALDNNPLLFSELNYNLQWFHDNKSFFDSIMSIYDSDLLRSDYYDHLGDMYHEIFPQNTPIVNSLIKTSVPKTVLDSAAKTGRQLMALYKSSPHTLLFGVEDDLRLYRIAYTNFLIHDIPGYLLHADSSKHEINYSTKEGKHNWKYYNKWNSCMNKLLPKCKNTTKIQ